MYSNGHKHWSVSASPVHRELIAAPPFLLPFERSRNFAYAISFRRCFARHDPDDSIRLEQAHTPLATLPNSHFVYFSLLHSLTTTNANRDHKPEIRCASFGPIIFFKLPISFVYFKLLITILLHFSSVSTILHDVD